MGCSILDMPFHLDLFLLEVLFVCTIKMSRNGIFSLSAQISSLQLVTGLPNSNKGGAKGHVLVRGPWVGLVEHSDRYFCPRHTLSISGRIGSIFLCLLFVVYLVVVFALTFLFCVMQTRKREVD